MTDQVLDAEYIDDLRSIAASIRATRDRVDRTEVTEESADGQIRVSVDGRGRLAGLEFGDRIFRDPDSRNLSDSIIDTVCAAQAAAERAIDG